MSHPLPTRLIFLSNLHNISPGEKVRFLGCVTNYNTTTAALTLQHQRTRLNPHTTSTEKALIDVSLLLSTISATDTQIGEWVHIIGYITSKPDGENRRGAERSLEVRVQALVLWSAKDLKLDEYERVVRERLSMG